MSHCLPAPVRSPHLPLCECARRPGPGQAGTSAACGGGDAAPVSQRPVTGWRSEVLTTKTDLLSGIRQPCCSCIRLRVCHLRVSAGLSGVLSSLRLSNGSTRRGGAGNGVPANDAVMRDTDVGIGSLRPSRSMLPAHEKHAALQHVRDVAGLCYMSNGHDCNVGAAGTATPPSQRRCGRPTRAASGPWSAATWRIACPRTHSWSTVRDGDHAVRA